MTKLYSLLETFASGRVGGGALGTRHGGAVTRWPSAVSLSGGGGTLGGGQQPASRSNSIASVTGALTASMNEQSAMYSHCPDQTAGDHETSPSGGPADQSVRL